MIIKAYDYQKIKKIKNNIFLFYGENEGYKNQVIKDIFITNFKGNVERLDESEVLNNFENFISGLINKSFFDELKIMLNDIERQALHAKKIIFNHPKNDKIISIEAPIPLDIKKIENKIEKING